MSLANLEHAMIRIKSASNESPIAVFKSDELGLVNVVFGSTYLTQKLLRQSAYATGFIGLFNKDMDMEEVKRAIKKAMKN